MVWRDPRDSVRVQILPTFRLTEDVAVWLPVRPTVVLEKLPSSVAGFGIQTLNVMVSVLGDLRRDSVRVALTATPGFIEPNEVTVRRGGHANATLHSTGSGQATISATSPGVDRADAAIQYSWPVDFLVLSLLGGGIGAVTTQLSRARRSKTRPWRRFFAGCLAGFVTAIAYFGLGVNLLQLHIPNQLFNQSTVFGLALLGGMFGIAALANTNATKAFFAASESPGGAS